MREPASAGGGNGTTGALVIAGEMPGCGKVQRASRGPRVSFADRRGHAAPRLLGDGERLVAFAEFRQHQPDVARGTDGERVGGADQPGIPVGHHSGQVLGPLQVPEFAHKRRVVRLDQERIGVRGTVPLDKPFRQPPHQHLGRDWIAVPAKAHCEVVLGDQGPRAEMAHGLSQYLDATFLL